MLSERWVSTKAIRNTSLSLARSIKMEGFDRFDIEYKPLTFPSMILFILLFSRTESVGPSEILSPLSESVLLPSSSAPELGLGVKDGEGWTKNPLFGEFWFVVEVVS